MKEASFSWNPQIRSTLTAVGKNDINDQLDIDDFVKSTQIDDSNSEAQTAAGGGTRNLRDVGIPGNGLTPSQGNAETLLSTNNKSQNDNDDSFIVDLPAAGIESMNLTDEFILANGSPSEGEVEATLSKNKSQNDNDNSFVVDLPAAGKESMNLLANGSPGNGDDKAILSNNNTTLSEAEISQGSASPQNLWILSGISKITELTLDLFENNYKLFAQKLVDVETDLVIRAILLKNNEVIFNYSFKIQGTDNVHDATITATNKVCNLFLGFALKGDTIICSLGAGYNSAHISITRNMHISNFINTLHKIKDTTGLYIIITASKYDWLEYAGGNTTYEDLFVTQNKKVIREV